MSPSSQVMSASVGLGDQARVELRGLVQLPGAGEQDGAVGVAEQHLGVVAEGVEHRADPAVELVGLLELAQGGQGVGGLEVAARPALELVELVEQLGGDAQVGQRLLELPDQAQRPAQAVVRVGDPGHVALGLADVQGGPQPLEGLLRPAEVDQGGGGAVVGPRDGARLVAGAEQRAGVVERLEGLGVAVEPTQGLAEGHPHPPGLVGGVLALEEPRGAGPVLQRGDVVAQVAEGAGDHPVALGDLLRLAVGAQQVGGLHGHLDELLGPAQPAQAGGLAEQAAGGQQLVADLAGLDGRRLGQRHGLLELLVGEGPTAELVQDPGTIDPGGLVQHLPELVLGGVIGCQVVVIHRGKHPPRAASMRPRGQNRARDRAACRDPDPRCPSTGGPRRSR